MLSQTLEDHVYFRHGYEGIDKKTTLLIHAHRTVESTKDPIEIVSVLRLYNCHSSACSLINLPTSLIFFPLLPMIHVTHEEKTRRAFTLQVILCHLNGSLIMTAVSIRD